MATEERETSRREPDRQLDRGVLGVDRAVRGANDERRLDPACDRARGSGRSVARIIRNSPTSGGSPSLNTTGRRRTIAGVSRARGRLEPRALLLGKDAGEHAARREMARGDARVVGDVAAQLEAARDLLRMVAFDPGAERKVRRAAEHQVEASRPRRARRHRGSRRAESRTATRVRCRRPTCAPA